MNKNYQRLKCLISFAISSCSQDAICQAYAMCIAFNCIGLICDSDFEILKKQIYLNDI